LTNPATDSSTGYDVTITILDEGVTELESTQMRVYILDDVTVTATVDATLTFTVSGLSSGASVNGITTNATAQSATTSFGTLAIDGSSTTLAQRLNVTTNANNGFSVTVQQTDELTNGAGANINSFIDSPDETGSSTNPAAWVSPTGVLGQANTYGHMGLTSSDDDLSWGGGDPFGTALFAGLNGTEPLEIMYHNSIANGTGEGQVDVAYGIEINALQEAGDYQTTLTYVCTPTY
jgi:hypothetical protein